MTKIEFETIRKKMIIIVEGSLSHVRAVERLVQLSIEELNYIIVKDDEYCKLEQVQRELPRLPDSQAKQEIATSICNRLEELASRYPPIIIQEPATAPGNTAQCGILKPDLGHLLLIQNVIDNFIKENQAEVVQSEKLAHAILNAIVPKLKNQEQNISEAKYKEIRDTYFKNYTKISK